MSCDLQYALDRNGKYANTSANKSRGPFKCLGCTHELVLCQGKKVAWYYRHKTESKCDGGKGGETITHEAAKHIIADEIYRWTFLGQKCKNCDKREFEYKFPDWCEADVEVRYGEYRLDVGVFDQGFVRGCVEVCHTSPVKYHKSCDIREDFGLLIEVEARHILEVYANDGSELECFRDGYRCSDCTKGFELMSKMAEEQRLARQEKERSEELKRQFLLFLELKRRYLIKKQEEQSKLEENERIRKRNELRLIEQAAETKRRQLHEFCELEVRRMKSENERWNSFYKGSQINQQNARQVAQKKQSKSRNSDMDLSRDVVVPYGQWCGIHGATNCRSCSDSFN